MSMMLLAAVALGSASQTADVTRTLTVNHQGAPVAVRYDATVDLQTKQVGSSAPTRTGVVRCDWTADVTVRRHIDGSDGALGREIMAGEPMRGSRPGDCMTNRKAIADMVAARQGEVETRLAGVIDRDRGQLLAELDAVRSLASTD